MALITLTHDLTNENARDLSVYSNDLKDAELDQAFSTVNKGFYAFAQIGRGVGKGATEYRFLALYDLANAIPVGATIVSAYWWLCINASTLASPDPGYTWEIATVYRTVKGDRDDWHEGYVCWDNYKQYTPWTAPGGGGDYGLPIVNAAVPVGVTNVWFTNDVTTIVQSILASNLTKVDMIFRRTDGLSDEGIVTVYTKQSGTPPGPENTVFAPHLRITYTLDSRTFQVMIR